MATLTMEPATRAKQIKTAIKSLEQDSWTESLLDKLDELEFERRLEISIEQADRGEVTPIDEFEKKIRERLANGYYTKENAKKRIEERAKKWKVMN